MFTFNHSGKMGDLLYSLYFCKAVLGTTKDDKFDFNIQVDVPETLTGREKGIPRLSQAGAEYIVSFLKDQPYINKLTISKEFDPSKYERAFNLDNFRQLKLNYSNGYIADWYFNLTNFPLKRNFEEQLIDVKPNPDFNGKAVFLQTKKYINPFVDLNILKKWEDKLVFIGLDDEYDIVKPHLHIPHYKASSGLEVAQALKGAAVTISNQNGNFAIAELMKVNRILLPAQYELCGAHHNTLERGPVNVFCHGGWFEHVNTT